MINIKIDGVKGIFKVSGHANSNVPGKDLVCCAVSTLVQNINIFLENVKAEEERQEKKGVQIKSCESGMYEAHFPLDNFSILFFLQNHVKIFEILQEDYPEYVKFNIRYQKPKKQKSKNDE